METQFALIAALDIESLQNFTHAMTAKFCSDRFVRIKVSSKWNKFPSNLNCDGKIAYESDPWSTFYFRHYCSYKKMRHYSIGSTFAQAITHWLFGTKPSNKPMLKTYCPSGTKFQEIWIQIHRFNFKKMHLGMLKKMLFILFWGLSQYKDAVLSV